MKVFVALVRSNETGFDEPVVCSPSEDYVKKELRAFCEFNFDSQNWDVNSARVEPVWYKDKEGAK